MSEMHASPSGSEWHRWDPHIHAPGTLLSDRFSGDWDAYLRRIETASPVVQAVGVTDYFCIRGYKRALEFKKAGRLKDVLLLFPNVELRLTIETEQRKPINLHLLFSPHDPDHVDRIERALGRLTFRANSTEYSCRLEEFARLGMDFDPKQKDQEAAIRAGANQFKVSLSQLQDLFRNEKWVRDSCLIAVAGTRKDGPAGLQGDSSFATTRMEIEAFADIIFASQTTSRDFWLGRRTGFSPEVIEKTYRALKPCLHGSDAHADEEVSSPDLDRYCWVKADLTFEGLRQAVIEPAERVSIGPAAPETPAAFNRARAVHVAGAPWFPSEPLPLNPGLVAIVGERGSGKTALADIIACAARALEISEKSFVHRASKPVDHLKGARVHLEWGDGSPSSEDLREFDDFFDESGPARIRYLSQQFVEALCSSDGLGQELMAEIEAVIFQSIDETDRYNSSSFSELRDTRLEPIQARRATRVEAVREASERIAREDALKVTLAAEQDKHTALKSKVKAAAAELASLVPKGQEERAKHFAALDELCRAAAQRIQQFRLQAQKARELADEVQRVKTFDEPRRLLGMKQRYAAAGLTDPEWAAFSMMFAADPDAVTTRIANAADAMTQLLLNGAPNAKLSPQPDASWPLEALRNAREAERKAVGVDEAKNRRFVQLKQDLSKWQPELNKLEQHMVFIAGADERRKGALAERRAAYAAVFDTLVEEKAILDELYQPLQKRLHASGHTAAKLEFTVVRRVDVDAWVRRGEELLDLRAAGSLRGRGTLKAVVEKELAPAWELGASADVAAAMTAFLERYSPSIIEGKPPSVIADQQADWLQRVAAWLYSTDHISLEYGIRYDGTDLQRLSPGTKGIVLLTLYLAVDEWDHRPLLIDQPEENLDPRSVFSELVGFFRSARSRRQVILVTHNANLVVNTDADQVIVASATRATDNGLPHLSYVSGSLENKRIRSAVCDLLEGGERAFRDRERRYRLRWSEGISEP